MRFLLLLLLFSVSPALAEPPLPLSLPSLQKMAARQQLAPPESYLRSARRAREVFLAQGGLVAVDPTVPTVVLPDLHAQRDYLLQALQLRIGKETLFSALAAGRANLLCLGDAMHSELHGQERWLRAEQELSQSNRSPALAAEMVDSLGLLQMLMELKVAYPKHFFFVRGNHEDMDPLVPYYKFTRTGESVMVRKWVVHNLGQSFLDTWHACELAMPLIAQGASFVGSHSPPQAPLSLDEVKKRTNAAFRLCTWSDNTRWAPGGAEERAFAENCRLLGVTAARPWLVGHRKVTGSLYRSQCGGTLIQINPLDTETRVYILAPAKGHPFDPTRDVHALRG